MGFPIPGQPIFFNFYKNAGKTVSIPTKFY